MDLRLTARSLDSDRYLASLFADGALQPALWALIILNAEIARTREMVTDTTLGLIRLQWWRERLNAITQGKINSDHPVLEFLSHTRISFSADDFDNLIYAREFDLENVLPSDQAGMNLYACATNTPLLNLFATVLNIEQKEYDDLAIAYGLIGLLRAIPFHASQHRCYLPQSEIEKYNIKLETLFLGHAQHGFSELCADILDVAQMHLKKARLNHSLFLALKSIAELNATQIKAGAYDPFAPKFIAVPAFKELRVALAVLKG